MTRQQSDSAVYWCDSRANKTLQRPSKHLKTRDEWFLERKLQKYHKHTDASSLLSLEIASLSSSNVHGMILREERAREKNCTTQKQQHWVTTGGDLCCRSDALCWRYKLRARNTKNCIYGNVDNRLLTKSEGTMWTKKSRERSSSLSRATRHNDIIFRDIVSAREGALWWWWKIQNINCRWSAPTTEPENIYAYCTKSAEQLK